MVTLLRDTVLARSAEGLPEQRLTTVEPLLLPDAASQDAA